MLTAWWLAGLQIFTSAQSRVSYDATFWASTLESRSCLHLFLFAQRRIVVDSRNHYPSAGVQVTDTSFSLPHLSDITICSYAPVEAGTILATLLFVGRDFCTKSSLTTYHCRLKLNHGAISAVVQNYSTRSRSTRRRAPYNSFGPVKNHRIVSVHETHSLRHSCSRTVSCGHA